MKKLGEEPTFKCEYGDGGWFSNYIAQDVIRLGKAQIFDQSFGVTEVYGNGPIIPKWTQDGLLGLGFDALRVLDLKYGKSLVENGFDLFNSWKSERIFACHIPSVRSDDSKGRQTGFFTYQGWDMSFMKECVSPMKFVDLVVRPIKGEKREPGETWGYWAFPSEFLWLNDERIGRQSNVAIADTGSELAYINATLCEKFYSLIPGSKKDASNALWLIPKSTEKSKIPRLCLAVGGLGIWIAPEDIFHKDSNEQGYLIGGIQARDGKDDLLGAVFLKNVYSVWRTA